jgi:hypothetical protein
MKASRRMTRFVPKLTLGAVVLAIGFMAKILVPHFEDPDFYWHVKTGEYLLSSWPLPRSDVFTYTHSGSPWVLSEWLAQVALYLVFHFAGYLGTAVFVAAMCAICGWFTYLNCRRHMDNPVYAIIMAVSGSLILLTAAPRPQLFSFVCFAGTLFVLLEFKYKQRDRLLVLLPIIMLLWANTHGGFFIGLVLIFLFTGSEWLRCSSKTNRKFETERLRKIGLWSVVACLATLVNPQHIQLWWYPIQAILLSGDTQTINEWQSPSFHVPMTQGFLALVLLFFSSQAWSRRRPDLTEVVIPLVFIASALVSARNMPLACMALTPFLAINLTSRALPVNVNNWLHRFSKRSRTTPEAQEYLVNWTLLIVVFTVIALCYPGLRKKQEAVVASYMPVGAANFILANHISGRMFNSYEYGGYLIFRLYPEQKVFIYGRTDIYRDQFVKTLDDIQQGRPDWKTLFDRYDIDYLVCDSSIALRQLLLQEGDFRLAYDDGLHSVLLKKIDRFDRIKAVVLPRSHLQP